ncbi:hypothetical protein D9M68_644570 [compost metagenome]
MLRKKDSRALLRQIIGIARLVVVDRVGQRHQERRQAGGGQFAHGQGAGAADDQIGPGVGTGHVLDEGRDLGFDRGLAITLRGDLVMFAPGLVEHLRPQVRRHLGQGFRQQLVQGLGAQAAAQHQQARLAACQGIARRFQEQLLAHRIAGGAPLVALAEGIGEGLAHAAGERHQAAVGGAGHGVLLVDDQRYAGQARGQTAGAGDIAAHAEHADRLQLTHDAARLEQRLEQLEGRLEQGLQALAAQAAHLDQVQRQAGLGHQLVLDTSRRAQPMHHEAARLELAGAGQGREHVAAGAAGHDQHVAAHGRTSSSKKSLSTNSTSSLPSWVRRSHSMRSSSARLTQQITRELPP